MYIYPNILPKIRLGYDIRDTCISENIAVTESVIRLLEKLATCLDRLTVLP